MKNEDGPREDVVVGREGDDDRELEEKGREMYAKVGNGVFEDHKFTGASALGGLGRGYGWTRLKDIKVGGKDQNK